MTTTLATIRPLIAMVAVAVLACACTVDSDRSVESAGEPLADAVADRSVESAGEPLADAMADRSVESAGEPLADAMADRSVESAGSVDAVAEPETASFEAAERVEGVAEPGDDAFNDQQARLTGGSIDDNERFDDYLAYRTDFFGLGIPVRDLSPRGRIVVTVTGEGGLPAAGTEVIVTGDGEAVSLRTTADGTVRFHPEAYETGDGPFTVSAGEATATATPGQDVSLVTSLPTAMGGSVALDVLFLLDATGSMDDEIRQLKVTIDEVAQRIHRLPVALDVLLGMTLYRDEGEAFLTSTFDFTPDVAAFADALSAVVALDGGDYPEALDEALADALSQPSWRSPSGTVQLVFLVADAPPQVRRQVPVPYTDSMREAAGRGIKIFPVSSSGTDDQAEFVFRQLAQFTGARYVFLTYGAGGRATGESTDIDQRDYAELSLDDLIVRLVAEELAALRGGDGG